jgi:hypothetical protein
MPPMPPPEHTSVSIRQHTPAYASIRQHTSAHASIRQHTSELRQHYVSIRQHTSAYFSIRKQTSANVSIRLHTSAYVCIRQHTAAGDASSCNGCNGTPPASLRLERAPCCIILSKPVCGSCLSEAHLSISICTSFVSICGVSICTSFVSYVSVFEPALCQYLYQSCLAHLSSRWCQYLY